jgi:hypothetical protein
MITLEDFLENAQIEGICERYSKSVINCGSKKQLMDIALDVNGADYLCTAIAEGWGISPSEISKRFAPYVNGRYILDNGKYTSAMYCQYNGSIECKTTLLTLVECNIEVEVPQGHICEIYICGNCNIKLNGKGRVLLASYGNLDNFTIETDVDINCKYFRRCPNADIMNEIVYGN